MDSVLHLLFMVIIANGAPVFMHYVFNQWCDWPVDFGKDLWDGRRIFGKSKTWRGLLAAIIATPVFAMLLGYSPTTGLMVAVYSMAGDLFSSFLKRRMNIAPSSMTLFLDQIPEVLLPAVLLAHVFNLDLSDIILLVLLFVIIELLLSQLLYKWGIRKRPY